MEIIILFSVWIQSVKGTAGSVISHRRNNSNIRNVSGCTRQVIDYFLVKITSKIIKPGKPN